MLRFQNVFTYWKIWEQKRISV